MSNKDMNFRIAMGAIIVGCSVAILVISYYRNQRQQNRWQSPSESSESSFSSVTDESVSLPFDHLYDQHKSSQPSTQSPTNIALPVLSTKQKSSETVLTAEMIIS
eukprot:270478_1